MNETVENLGSNRSERLGEIVQVPVSLGQGLFKLRGKKLLRYDTSVEPSEVDDVFAPLALPTLSDMWGHQVEVIYPYNDKYYGQTGNRVIEVDFTNRTISNVYTLSERTDSISYSSLGSINPNTGRIAFVSSTNRQVVIFTNIENYNEYKFDFGTLANTASGSMNRITYVCDNTWVATSGSNRLYISRDDGVTWSDGQYVSNISGSAVVTHDANYIYAMEKSPHNNTVDVLRVSRTSGGSWFHVKTFSEHVSVHSPLYFNGNRKFYCSASELIYTDNNLNSFTKITIPVEVQQGIGSSFTYVTFKDGVIELWQRDNTNNRTHIYNVNPTTLAVTYNRTISKLTSYGHGAAMLLPDNIDSIYGHGSGSVGFYEVRNMVHFISNDDANKDDAIIVG